MKRFTNEVWMLFWKLPVQRWEFTSMQDAVKSNDLVLRAVKPIWRPLCRVKWIDA